MAQCGALMGMGMRTEHLVAFDLWLRGNLSQEAASSLAEPLPEEWLRLLPPDGDAEAA